MNKESFDENNIYDVDREEDDVCRTEDSVDNDMVDNEDNFFTRLSNESMNDSSLENSNTSSNDIDGDNDYLDSLANETNDWDLADEVGDSRERIKSYFNKSNNGDGRGRPKINMPLLIAGVVLIVTPIAIKGMFSGSNERRLSDSRVEADYSNNYNNDNSNAVKEESSVVGTEGSVIVDVVDEDELATEEKPMDGQHLTGIPVVVTDEVNEYFEDSVGYLKRALAIDKFVAENTIYKNGDNIKALQKLVDDFNNETEEWSNHVIPDGCEDYDELISKSLSAYQYYFEEVIVASNLETLEEYRNKLDSAISYIQTLVSGYGKVSKEFEPVFYYYGLYE